MAKRTFNLTDTASALTYSAGNSSRYITRLVESHSATWREAYAQLGWAANYVLCAIDVCAPLGALKPWDVGALVRELSDGDLVPKCMKRHEVRPQSWYEAADELSKDPIREQSLLFLVSEHYLSNKAVVEFLNTQLE